MAEFLNIKGGAELQKLLDQLPVKIEKNIMRSALRAGARVIANEAKAIVPVDDGDLKRSIRTGSSAKRGKVIAYVRAGGKKGSFYAHMVEFGTAAHLIVPKNRKSLSIGGQQVSAAHHPGAQAKPFMRPAFDNKANEAIVAVGEQIRRRLTAYGINHAPALEVDEE
jgi:HK97 gp10 family phage protein